MRQVSTKGLITVAAASGLLAALSATGAHADSGAAGAAVNSPGVASGNSVQVPVHVPVNVCGNTVNVVGVLNPAFGNNCVNDDRGRGDDGGQRPGGGHQGADAEGAAVGSPGVASGNNVQVPVDVPVNACGNSVNIIGLGNSAFGNGCSNDAPLPPPPAPEEPEVPEEPEEPEVPEAPEEPEEEGPEEEGPAAPREPADEPEAEPAAEAPQLAATGGGLPLGAALPLGAGLLAGGVVLYRRGRLARHG
ncbi:chaplin [Streptomyces sp. SBT349]|uniref:chaplin n=1 Tax=Streptomyces sp. SBT349 TaxID=1580539 RepID=UPI00066E500C|nr:chaplin [Streptomyces sp. SBT349]